MSSISKGLQRPRLVDGASNKVRCAPVSVLVAHHSVGCAKEAHGNDKPKTIQAVIFSQTLCSLKHKNILVIAMQSTCLRGHLNWLRPQPEN